MKNPLLLVICLVLSSCKLFHNNDNFENSDLVYLEKLGLFSKEETIIWFDSQMDKKTSGNFLTNKRIASYWIDKHDKNKSFKNFYTLDEIDSLQLFDLSKSASRSSYIEVYSQGKSMKVYIDKDSTTLNNYLIEFEEAIKK